ncbi:hydroxymethylbilane synthase [Candidatus Micrarchaeota archaeon]|nr:hydroxymethylbilane synthase [Candidatus Micrarchaeota archaeon]
MKIIIGTRGSALALWQARFVADELTGLRPDLEVELSVIKTSGDIIRDVPLAKIGAKGLFTKEIEEALIDGAVDLAVHSMKDLPTELPSGLQLSAIMERENPCDAFISRDGSKLEDLGPGAKVGTSSLRRRAFLLAKRPYLQIKDIRGNVDTRIKKIDKEGLDGALLACAGVIRMGMSHRITEALSAEEMIPAIGQGAMGIETREDDGKILELVKPLNHLSTAACVAMERAFLYRMGGGCQVPLAAHAWEEDGRIELISAVVHPDGSPIIINRRNISEPDPNLGLIAADDILSQGGDKVLRSVLGADWSLGEDTEMIMRWPNYHG